MGRIPKLTEISVSMCVRHVNNITDLGDLPYHLVRPILLKMPAKQLDVVETASGNLMPFSDELWQELIQKDFPTRPHNVISKVRARTMPYKNLYLQYVEEQEQFKKNSTERLKHMTNIIKQKKSENSIVELDGILRDPTVRVQKSYSGITGNKNSILNRAKRELLSRSLMFPKRSGVIKPIRRPHPPRPTRSVSQPSKTTITRTDIGKHFPPYRPSLATISPTRSSSTQPLRPSLMSSLTSPSMSPSRSPLRSPSKSLELKISISRPKRLSKLTSFNKNYNDYEVNEPKSDIKSIKSSVFD